jgi:hypothetical protein
LFAFVLAFVGVFHDKGGGDDLLTMLLQHLVVTERLLVFTINKDGMGILLRAVV